ncbi:MULTISPECIES: gluconokinase, GntK/IdnK-type [unclassified Sphingomonas]|uniref:gluconokinase n=1 Tax=unclassified Sphingomonas TaxID=196159 RepID=UPI000926080B|nr:MULTISPECIES: gluconokinase, GntK/IdnK-type [unclassified Sphingomonas]OJU15017.1 MAG: gluconokinase [Sphingomonas sp. 66-10]
MVRAIVVMGVAGCGKSTLAAALAEALGWTFIEGDRCHPPANVAKMAAGIALDDADRAPFLAAVGDALAGAPGGAVASCSALRRRYRDALRARVGEILFVLPVVPPGILAARLAARRDHFMPGALLESQIAALEPPEEDERALLVDGEAPVAAQLAAVCAALAPA